MYARVENNNVLEYPLTQAQIKKRFPYTSFTIPFFPPNEYVDVINTAPPQIDYTKNLVEDTPVNTDQTWFQVWSVVDATPEEISQRTESKANEIRDERNNRLAKCDWTQFTDSPLSPADKLAWGTYREELRQVPQQPGFPWDITWPAEPSTV